MNQKALDIIHQIQDTTRCRQINIHIDKTHKPEITESKLGGIPYWPSNKQYPVDSSNKPFVFVAQFNCEALPETDELPRKGILQFFVSYEWEEGIVVYHEQIDPDVTEESSKKMCGDGFVYSARMSPVHKECAVWLSVGEGWMSVVDHHCEAEYAKLARANCPDDETIPMDFNDIVAELESSEYDSNVLPSTGSHLLGYPYFTQWDPRENDCSDMRLLFQLDSEVKDKQWHIMWGDCGVGNFFIRDEDLAARDFSNVMFAWDCC